MVESDSSGVQDPFFNDMFRFVAKTLKHCFLTLLCGALSQVGVAKTKFQAIIEWSTSEGQALASISLLPKNLERKKKDQK